MEQKSTLIISNYKHNNIPFLKNLKTSPGLEPEPRELQSLVIPIRLQGQKKMERRRNAALTKKLNFCFEKLIKFF